MDEGLRGSGLLLEKIRHWNCKRMRIDTIVCEACGMIVAGNVLESERVTKCPGFNCEEVLRFEDLSEEAHENLIENRNKYRMD